MANVTLTFCLNYGQILQIGLTPNDIHIQKIYSWNSHHFYMNIGVYKLKNLKKKMLLQYKNKLQKIGQLFNKILCFIAYKII